MCGRVIRTSPVEALREYFDLDTVPAELSTRYNLAPRQAIPVIRAPGQLELLRWGLDMPDPRHAGINARVESLSRPIYREKLRHKRCLVVVDGFYEWRKLGGKKQPYLITRGDHAPLALAGIYDSSDGCAILTTRAEGVVAALHDRMPVVLTRDQLGGWLDASRGDVTPLLAAANANGLVAYPVSTRVNSVRNDDPSLAERVPEPAPELPKGVTLRLF